MILDQLFENNRAPGSAYDRGGADAWYHRARRPHKIVDGHEVALTDPREIDDYNRGYDDEGITGRHQGKQYDVREDDLDEAVADWSPLGRESMIKGRIASLERLIDHYKQKGDIARAQQLQAELGTVKRKLDQVWARDSRAVSEGKPVAHSIDYAVWSRKSPDEQQMLRQLHPKLKIKNVPPKPRAERVKKGKIDYAAIARKAEAVLGSTFPDGDPMDWMYPYISRHLKDVGIPKEKQYGKYEVYPILDRAIKMHVDKKGYDHWLETTWDQVADDNMMPGTVTRDNNPWRVAEGMVEAGPFSYGAKKHPKGSIKYLAAQRRRQQERNKPVIEPKDQMVGTAKVKPVKEGDLGQFHRNLGQRVRDRAAQDQAEVAIARARDPMTWLWKPGDQVLSKKTGRTYTITAHALNARHGAMYHYQRGQKGSDDFERGSFIADRAHQGLTKLNLEGSDQLAEKWSEKYRRSINCNNPRGFSQRAHCAGRKKNESVQEGSKENKDQETIDYVNQELAHTIKTKFNGIAWFNGGSYSYLLNIKKPNAMQASDGSPIRVKSWAQGIKDYADRWVWDELENSYPDYWETFLRPYKKGEGQPEHEYHSRFGESVAEGQGLGPRRHFKDLDKWQQATIDAWGAGRVRIEQHSKGMFAAILQNGYLVGAFDVGQGGWVELQRGNQIDEAPLDWQGKASGTAQSNVTDHTFDEALGYLKSHYPVVKQYLVRRAELGFRAWDHPKLWKGKAFDPTAIDQKQMRKSEAHIHGVDGAVDYLQLKQNAMMSGSKQLTYSIGYNWSTMENPSTGIAIVYYQDRGMGSDEIYIGGTTREKQIQARQVFRDAGVLPIPKPKVKKQGMAEGDVIHTKFATKQAQRGRDRYHKVEGLDIPVFDRAVGRAMPPNLARDPTPFDHFVARRGKVMSRGVTKQGNWYSIIGVLPNGKEYTASTTPSEQLAQALTATYNRGGFTDLDLRPARIKGYNDDPEVTEADQAQRYVLYLNGRPAAHFASHSEAQRQAQAVLQRRPDTKFEIRAVTPGIIEDLRDPQDNPCWTGYHPVGTKKKAGRTVPNCVPNK
jgi:hypothetical protein